MDKYDVLLVVNDKKMQSRIASIIILNPVLQLYAAVDSIAAARNILDRHEPKVMLLDLALHDGSCISLLHEIRSRNYSTNVMVMSSSGDHDNVISVIEAGALGYILKDSKEGNINDFIMQMINNSSTISPSFASHIAGYYPISDDVPKLTVKEIETLEYMKKGYSNKEIAGYLQVTPNTISTHVKHIYSKLSVHSRGEAIFEAIKLGITRL